MTRASISLALLAAALAGPPATSGADPTPPGPSLPSYRTYAWPVAGPVIRPFEQPSGPFGPGHRGMDIGAPVGTTARASSDGIVAFAGKVAGEHHVSIDHPDGVRTSYSYLSSVGVRRGDPVARGEVVGSPRRATPVSSPRTSTSVPASRGSTSTPCCFSSAGAWSA